MVTTESTYLPYFNATAGNANDTIISTTPISTEVTQESGADAGVIAGAVVGSLLVLVIVVLFLYIVKRRGWVCGQKNSNDMKITSTTTNGTEWESDMYNDADVVKRDKDSRRQRDASKVQNIYVINHTATNDRDTASGPYLDFGGSSQTTNEVEANYEDVSEECGSNKISKECEEYDDVALSSTAPPEKCSSSMSRSAINKNKHDAVAAPKSEPKKIDTKPDADDDEGSGDGYFVLEKDQQQTDSSESYYIYDFNTENRKVKRPPVKTDSEESDHYYLEMEDGKIETSRVQERGKLNLRPDMTRMNSKEDAYSYAIPDENYSLSLPKSDRRPNTFPSNGNREIPVVDDEDLYTYCEY